MQFKTIVLSAFVALAAAESIQELVAQIPACTKKCLDDASKQIGCDASDNKCQCGKLDDLTAKATPCIIACTDDDMSSMFYPLFYTLPCRACRSSGIRSPSMANSSATFLLTASFYLETIELSGKICAKVGGAQVGSAVSSIASGASTAIGGALSTASAKATSVYGDITATASHAASTSTPTPAAAGRNMVGAGLAAAVVAMAL
ncbi:hypothetical protein PG997_006632 [Apiospora hydei]|uniref:CFEM domain-containing protein n=1 Tax=Apiospora hydei TaxID=1337664 RepID=A0ABR1WPA7_9PEZI